MTIDLLLVGNGPGELTGWIQPVARAARQLASTDLRMTLVLSPTQFAGGREIDVVNSWALFDRIVTPSEVIRLVLGMGTIPIGPQASVIHLGGDLWFSARVAQRLDAPAAAFAETPLILRRHRPFVRIFAASEDLAAHLRAHGVPAERITVTGDPRVDAVLGGPHTPRDGLDPRRRAPETSAASQDNTQDGERIAILAGSRDRYFRTLVPYFMRAANVIATQRPRVTFHVITAEFLSPGVITAMQEDVRQRWPTLRVVWVSETPWKELAHATLTLTIPGTNTVELAILGVPFAVIVPVELLDRVPTEGLLEYVGRLPGLGRLIKREAGRRYFARPRLVALPNLRAGHAIVPEWIGRWTPSELANRVGELLDDAPRRAEMQRELRQVYPSTGGAAMAIAREALALARTRKVERA